ncbi:MAG TPA: S9 family peptidase [Kiritimatiellia bacterium]|nr:S9 family peptidase [Kiritimatiellia bacterium]
MKHQASYGSWPSPIKPCDLAGACLGIQSPRIVDGTLFWLESRPAENGRCVVCSASGDAVPSGFSVRNRVHEYGGGAWTFMKGNLFFCNDSDRSIWRCRPKGPPEIFIRSDGARYADLEPDPTRNRLICIRADGALSAVISADVLNRTEKVLFSGADFYSSPRVSPDGKSLAWIEWNHPDMPWDSTVLCRADLDAAGNPGPAVRLAGGEKESVVQPQWSPDGRLYFVSDRTGWWNLYRAGAAGDEPVAPMDAEFAQPLWQFGMSNYAFVSDKYLAAAFTRDGLWALALVDTRTMKMRVCDLPFTSYDHVRAGNGLVVFLAGSPREPGALVSMNAQSGQWTVVKRTTDIGINPDSLSEPEPVAFPSAGGRTAYGLFYPPRNESFEGPSGEKPPLIVTVHGGPTAAVSPAFSLKTQFWTTRGIAVLDVNYAGSTGYGRVFREALYGQWGIADVDDCCAGAKYLAGRGLVDPDRMVISGGSAGGFTALSSLAFRSVFSAGIIRYGISDCSAMARDSHKFEAHYLDRLIAPYPARRDVYEARSPLFHAEGISRPVIFFQGLEDRVVPPEQTFAMYEALAARGVPAAYVAFEGEQHGFRKEENILRMVESELYFLSRIFNYHSADAPAPVKIANLSAD